MNYKYASPSEQEGLFVIAESIIIDLLNFGMESRIIYSASDKCIRCGVWTSLHRHVNDRRKCSTSARYSIIVLEVLMFLIGKWLRKEKTKVDMNSLPQHIAIIMDGNGRWARKRGLPRNIGHKEGSRNLRKIVAFCSKIGIKHLTVYAFSTENWSRPKSEVDGLMSLLLEYLRNAEKELGGENIRIKVIGDMNGLPEEIRREAARVTKITQKNTGLTLNIALNYGGRCDIISAVQEVARDVKAGKLDIESIDEQTLSIRLYTAGIPDPDLVIRTSGEKRISNFLLWQVAYSEFWYTDAYWPDFGEEHILQAIRDFQKRNRRFGGV